MSLGIKQLKEDPWENIEVKYPVGSKHTARVRNFTNFGVFVEIEEGVDGLIHISDLSWTKKVKHPSEFTSIGAEIEVVVLEIDKENRRLSLGCSTRVLSSSSSTAWKASLLPSTS